MSMSYWCPYKKTAIRRQRFIGRKVYDENRDWSHASSSQGITKIASKPPEPWFQTSGLPNCETINFCWFKPPSLWSFVTAALGN